MQCRPIFSPIYMKNQQTVIYAQVEGHPDGWEYLVRIAEHSIVLIVSFLLETEDYGGDRKRIFVSQTASSHHRWEDKFKMSNKITELVSSRVGGLQPVSNDVTSQVSFKVNRDLSTQLKITSQQSNQYIIIKLHMGLYEGTKLPNHAQWASNIRTMNKARIFLVNIVIRTRYNQRN